MLFRSIFSTRVGPTAAVCASLALVEIFVWPTVSRAAEPVVVGLDYEMPGAPVECPTEGAFRAMATQRLGYDPFLVGAAQRVAVRAESTEHGLTGSLAWVDGQGHATGEQQFASASRNCADLVHAMAFAFVVQVQLRAELASAAPPSGTASPSHPPTAPRLAPAGSLAPARTPGSAPAPRGASSAAAAAPAPGPATSALPPSSETDQPTTFPSPSESATPASPMAAAPPAARPAPHDRIQPTPSSNAPVGFKRTPNHAFFVGLGSGIALRLAPSASLDGHLFAGARYRAVSVEIGGEATAPTSTQLDDRSGFRHQYLAGSLALCGNRGPWCACGVGKLGMVRIRGFGVDVPLSASGLQPSAGARVALTQRLWDRIFATARAEWLASLTPWNVEINQITTWRTPGSSFLFGLDFGATFE